ncbi:MAG: sigma-70 family RNA polymerase sigma factor [Lentisphaeraceae bacterium]|nr:sigma-70 family RNA polymerase sigma factor [Lentisphaeraceae bacterium]
MAADNQIEKKVTSLELGGAELFISLFEADRNRLYSYIFAFMSDAVATDDIFQETSMVLWREFNKFTPGTSFSKWANGIAFNRIREYRRKNKKYAVGFSEEMLESLLEVVEKDVEEDTKWIALQACRKDLPEHTLELYEDFYVKNHKAQQIADKSGRSIFAIRKAIHKLRKKLFDCVDRKKRGEKNESE